MSSPPPPPPPSCVLFENAACSVVVVDIPRSIEEAQCPADSAHCSRRRLLSTAPLDEPFPIPQSLSPDSASHEDVAAQLADLMTRASVAAALDELRAIPGVFKGPWCLPRQCLPHLATVPLSGSGASYIPTPPNAHCLDGTIAMHRDQFVAEAPDFDLIVLDPPWPNRSARRRRRGRTRAAAVPRSGAAGVSTTCAPTYATATDMGAVRALLEQVPVGAKLGTSPHNLVAVWVTNKPACTALLTDPHHGLFRTWGVVLVATWTWLKITKAGAPVVPLDSSWRKPWERLLLARRPSAVPAAHPMPPLPSSRILLAVPDMHSRKPHLRPLLTPYLARDDGRPPVGLEVFARHLTADWWAWGDQALLFQQTTWWTSVEDGEGDGGADGPRQVSCDR